MKKKILALVLCVALAAVAIVGGTLAYFTDTDDQTNTFTMGNVGIYLRESKVKRGEDGQPVVETKDNGENRETGDDQTYHVFPGQSYTKDPTITVKSTSEDCWLVATVTISKRANLYALYANDTTGVKQSWGLSLAGEGQMVSGGLASYTAVTKADNDAAGTALADKVGTMLSKDGTDVAFLTYEEDVPADTITYTFYFKQAHKAGDKETLFETVTIPSIIDNGDIDSDLKITVKAYAIQKVGFDNVYKAYEAYKTQHP